MVMKNQTAGNDGKTGLLRRLAMTDERTSSVGVLNLIQEAIRYTALFTSCFFFRTPVIANPAEPCRMKGCDKKPQKTKKKSKKQV
jgi:hypothetical protein